MKVALVTHAGLPDLADDDRLLPPELERLGVHARPAVWSDPRVVWNEFDAAVLRSTWDYHLRRAEFLDWVDEVARATRLWNPAPVVRWNSHKSYLRDLQRRGVAIVPTVWSDGSKSLAELFEEHRWSRAVFKPAVSAAAHRTHLATRDSLAVSEPLYRQLCAEHEVLVQPYLSSVETPGEHSLIFVDHEFSHAVDRRAALSPEHGPAGGQPVASTEEERAFGSSVLRALDTPTLYARADLARTEEGALCLMELELVEPSLFLASSAEAPRRLARAIAARLG
ncbi:MAG: hypothetical protein ABSB90_07645 [Thermoplasmata archaeon]|jgi:hypothetical protein